MAEIITLGRVAGEEAAQWALSCGKMKQPDDAYYQVSTQLLEGTGMEDAIALKRQIQKAAWECVGPVRDHDGLMKALSVAEKVRKKVPQIGLHCRTRVFNREWIDGLSLWNMCDILEAVARSALTRKENVGSHFRLDGCEQPEESYSVWIKRRAGKMEAEKRPVGRK